MCMCECVFASTRYWLRAGECLSTCLRFRKSVFAQGMPHVRFVIDSYCSAHPTGASRSSCALPRQVKDRCFSCCFPLLGPRTCFLGQKCDVLESSEPSKCVRNAHQMCLKSSEYKQSIPRVSEKLQKSKNAARVWLPLPIRDRRILFWT